MAASSVTATARMTVSAQEMAARMETAMAKSLVKPKDPAMAEGWERRMAVGSAPKMAVGWAASSALDLVTVSLSAADSAKHWAAVLPSATSWGSGTAWALAVGLGPSLAHLKAASWECAMVPSLEKASAMRTEAGTANE